MSTATLPAAKPQQTVISFTPLGEREPINLTVEKVAKFLCVPTKSGQRASVEQMIKFMMLCKAQGLNPWVNDAYLVGYDSKDGPSFSLIVAHQAMLKRSEASEDFAGIESGVVVKSGDTITERPGKIIFEGERLVGGWCRVHRSNLKIPVYDTVQLSVYDKRRSRWIDDPSGMIVKVAEAAALRKAFPSNLAGLYCQEEFGHGDTLNELHVGEPNEPPDHPAIQQQKPASRATQVQRANPAVTQKPAEPEQEPKYDSQYDPEPVESTEDTPLDSDPGNSMGKDLATEAERFRQAFKLAEPNAQRRLDMYETWGIKSPAVDDEWSPYSLPDMWAYIEEINESKKM